jgi:hypothetical protein
MVAKDRPERWETSVGYANVSLTGRFKLAAIVGALNAATILVAFHLKSGFPLLLGLFGLALLFYVALILSIYVFHKPARWAFLGVLDTLLLAGAVHWIQ